jgi:hypothetical protein
METENCPFFDVIGCQFRAVSDSVPRATLQLIEKTAAIISFETSPNLRIFTSGFCA